MRFHLTRTEQEVVAPVPAVLNAGFFVYLGVVSPNGPSVAAPTLAGEAIAAIVYTGVRALEHAGYVPNKTVRIIAATAIGIVFGSMVGAAEAQVFNRSVLEGLIWGAYGGFFASTTLSVLAPSEQAWQPPAPPDANLPVSILDFSSPDEPPTPEGRHRADP